jgi:AsmA protein
VKSLKGQGGADLDALAGFAIPVKITGTFAQPKYAMDFASIGTALAKSNLLDKVGGEKGTAVKELLGEGDKVKALEGLLSKKKKPAETAPAVNPESPAGSTTPAPAAGTEAAPAEKPKSAEELAKEKAREKLNKMLGL